MGNVNGSLTTEQEEEMRENERRSALATLSQELLDKLAENDPTRTELTIGSSDGSGTGTLIGRDLMKPGFADSRVIGDNTHLTKLSVAILREFESKSVLGDGFYEGIRRNSSITELEMICNGHSSHPGTVFHEIMKSFQESGNLISLSMNCANLSNGVHLVVADTLRHCKNLKSFVNTHSGMKDEELLPMVEAIRVNSMLEILDLSVNSIGDSGCQALATLLEDPNSNLRVLNLENNDSFGTAGATAIINSLSGNTKLEKLCLGRNEFNQDNPIDRNSLEDAFCRALCNTTSIGDTYSSNHSLEILMLGNPGNFFIPSSGQQHGQQLTTLLQMNEGANKSQVAIRKILKHHPNLDMSPLFEWGAEEDGERTLKALPYVINWFDRARVAVVDEYSSNPCDDGSILFSCHIDYYHIAERKLSAIFQFAKTMPLLFCMKVDVSKKRMRDDGL